MAGIAWAQPFSGGNKRTAFVCADTWLRMNGYTIIIDDENDVEYLRSLLFEIQDSRSDLDDLTLAKIILYVTKRLEDMTKDSALKIAQTSMRVNQHLLKSLGDEKKINMTKNPDEDIIKKLLDLVPKSTEGKLLALGAALIVGYILLKSK